MQRSRSLGGAATLRVDDGDDDGSLSGVTADELGAIATSLQLVGSRRGRCLLGRPYKGRAAVKRLKKWSEDRNLHPPPLETLTFIPIRVRTRATTNDLHPTPEATAKLCR